MTGTQNGSAFHRRTVLTAGVATAVVLGGGAAGFAAWTTASTSPAFTVRSAAIPAMSPPRITPGTPMRIAWAAVRLSTGDSVHRYRVVRHTGPAVEVVCDVEAGRTSCADPGAPVGRRVTYTVAATHGRHWTGPDSPPSVPIEVPAPPPALTPAAATGAVPSRPAADPAPGRGSRPVGDPRTESGVRPSGPPVSAPPIGPETEKSPSAGPLPAEREEVTVLPPPDEPQATAGP